MSSSLIIGMMGGPALCALEGAWYKLPLPDKRKERRVWLEAAKIAATKDGYKYAIDNETIHIL